LAEMRMDRLESLGRPAGEGTSHCRRWTPAPRGLVAS
jgi:hypothetical protein